jgi:hypothetical protein
LPALMPAKCFGKQAEGTETRHASATFEAAT